MSVWPEVLSWLLEVVADVRLVKLFDGEDKDRPWIASLLTFVAAGGLVMLVFFNHWFTTAAAWIFGVLIALLALVAYLDYQWWRERTGRWVRAKRTDK